MCKYYSKIETDTSDKNQQVVFSLTPDKLDGEDIYWLDANRYIYAKKDILEKAIRGVLVA